MVEELVIFSLGDEEYGSSILQVREIRRMIPITPLPRANDFVAGVINLRGKVIPMVDLRQMLGMEIKEPDKATRIVIVEIGESTVGAIVDSVSEVLKIEEIDPSMMGQPWVEGIGKIDERLIIILDFEKLFEEISYGQDKSPDSG